MSVFMVALWVRKYNTTFVQATTAESKILIDLMRSAGQRLPARLAHELDLIFKTIGR